MFGGFLQFKSTSVWNTTNKGNDYQESTFEVSFKITLANIHKNQLDYETQLTNRAPVAQFVEHRTVTREVVSSTLAGPTLRDGTVFK